MPKTPEKTLRECRDASERERMIAARLRAKYAQMRAMRLESDAPEDEVRSRMRALAAAFPGALVELDRLPMESLDARIAALELACAGAPLPEWAACIDRYHAWLRIALAVRAAPDAEKAEVLVERALEERLELGSSEQALRELRRPARGRLSEWARERVARDLGGLHAVSVSLVEWL